MKARIALLAVMALLIVACGSGSEGTTTTSTTVPSGSDTTAATDETTTTGEREFDLVRGTYSPIAAYAPLFVAMEQGFFEKWGINNEMDQVGINEALALVANGDYDWGRSENSPGWFNALNSGLDLYGAVDRLTYTCSADNSLSISKVVYDQGIDTFEELDGRTIGIIAPGTQAEYWLAQLLAEHNMSQSDVNVVYLSYADQLAALSDGTIDAAFMLEPLLSQGVADGSIVPIMSMLEVTPNANIGSMFFGAKFVERDGGDVAVRWIAAWLEAARFAQDPANRDAVMAAVQKWTEMTPESIARIYDGVSSWPQVNPNGYIDADLVLSTQGQFMLDGEFIDELPAKERIFREDLVARALDLVGEVDAAGVQLCAQ